MKNTILILVVIVCSSVTTFAQTTQGSLTFGGGFRYTSSKDDYDGNQKNTDFSFQPSAGYFVADNLAIGVTLSIASNKVDYGNSDNTTNQFLAGPFARYYKFTSNEKFAFTGEAGFLFGSSKTKYGGGSEIKGSSFDIYIAPGFTYFFSEKWGLDFQLRGITYSSDNPNKDADNKSSSFSFGLQSFSPSLGFRFYLSK